MNFRRHYTPGNIVFITQVVAERAPIFAQDDAVALLRETLHSVKALYPFDMLAYVFMPDHLHLLIRPTPPAQADLIMQSLKRNFTINYKRLHQFHKKPLRFWQPRYWDHIIRDEEDLEHHYAYIHYNPVKHGFVTRPESWPHSSYPLWLERGYYPKGWGWTMPDLLAEIAFEE